MYLALSYGCLHAQLNATVRCIRIRFPSHFETIEQCAPMQDLVQVFRAWLVTIQRTQEVVRFMDDVQSGRFRNAMDELTYTSSIQREWHHELALRIALCEHQLEVTYPV